MLKGIQGQCLIEATLFLVANLLYLSALCVDKLCFSFPLVQHLNPSETERLLVASPEHLKQSKLLVFLIHNFYLFSKRIHKCELTIAVAKARVFAPLTLKC